MTQLNQIVAVRQGVQARTHAGITKAHHDAQKAAPMSGLSRVYSPKDELGDQQPPESTRVQIRTHDLVTDFSRHLSDFLDVSATLDWGNCTAKADVVVDGHLVIKDAPITFLMFLEKQLTDVRTFFQKLQTLDPSENWQWDQANGWWRSDPQARNSTKKVRRNHVKTDATDKHPAQVEVYTEDEIVGTWTTTKFSGAIPAQEQAMVLDRVHKLQDAVKYARELANSAKVDSMRVGDALFSYLLGGGSVR
jgi:hypothetical protein